MFRYSKTNIALCGLVLMVVIGFGFQAVNADDDGEPLQLERIAQQSAQPQLNHDSSFRLTFAPLAITYYDDKLWILSGFDSRFLA